MTAAAPTPGREGAVAEKRKRAVAAATAAERSRRRPRAGAMVRGGGSRGQRESVEPKTEGGGHGKRGAGWGGAAKGY